MLPLLRRHAPVGHFLMLALALSSSPRAWSQEAEPPAAEPPIQQVRVEVRVLEWTLRNTMDFDFAVLFRKNTEGGILESADLTLTPAQALGSAARLFLSGIDTGSGSFESVIEVLETVGEVKQLHQPMLTVTVGQETAPIVSSGTKVPFQGAGSVGNSNLVEITQYRDTGVRLTATVPAIKYDEFVEIVLDASVTALTGFIVIGNDSDSHPLLTPVVSSRFIKSTILARDRSILIAGLLKSSRTIERRRGIPWISELPGFRSLTTSLSESKEVTELVFLVRPEILAPIEKSP